jgi:hypothetical protein
VQDMPILQRFIELERRGANERERDEWRKG